MPKTTFTATELIAASINNMPSQQLYLGRVIIILMMVVHLTANIAQAALLNDLLPGGGESEILKGDYNLSAQLTIRQLKIRS